MNSILDWFYNLDPAAAAWWLLVENVALFAASLSLGTLAERSYVRRRIDPAPGPFQIKEGVLAGVTVTLNWLITLAGWFLWKGGWIVVRRDQGLWAWLDVIWLLLIMDLAMYGLHRAAHWNWLYPMHRLHHEFDCPRPIDLFVLHPLETLAFGSLWLGVVMIHEWSFLGMTVYLTINLVSGTLGHLGVEPFPAWFDRVPLLRQIGTSTFHAGHHHNVRHNFGFYTIFWDRLFGTLEPAYDHVFGRFSETSGVQPTIEPKS